MSSTVSHGFAFEPAPKGLAARRAPEDDRLPVAVRAWVIVALSIGLWVTIVEGLAWLAG